MAQMFVSVAFFWRLLMIANSGGDVGIKLRPTKDELISMSPEFDHRWSSYFENAPDKPVMMMIPYAA